jgi:hypothetical protein
VVAPSFGRASTFWAPAVIAPVNTHAEMVNAVGRSSGASAKWIHAALPNIAAPSPTRPVTGVGQLVHVAR